MVKALKINQMDNVATVIKKIDPGEEVDYRDNDGSEKELKAIEGIPIYHKIAINDIRKGDHIVKYGEHIGLASQDIKIGQHVHTNNVESQRENLAERE